MARRNKAVGTEVTLKKRRRSIRRQTRPVAVPVPPAFLSSNVQDAFVVQKLASAKLGDLPVDRFGILLFKALENPVAVLRQGLIEAYQEAAKWRESAKASHAQVQSAQIALRSLTTAIDRLDRVKPSSQRSLQAIFGGPLDDHKGIDELNNLAVNCWQLKLDIAKTAEALGRAIKLETAKPSRAGERKKRLRTLVEALANWWQAKIGKSLAPYVYAKRLGKGVPAFVVGRQGDFIELAIAIFSNVDKFAESEVISAVTNVHESRLKETKR